MHCATNGLFIGGKQAEPGRNAAEVRWADLSLSAVEITCSVFAFKKKQGERRPMFLL